MAESRNRVDTVNERVASYRARAGREGLRRVETTVSMDDVNLMKDVARILREDGERADELRATLRRLLPSRRARTGKELVAFLRTCPLAGEDSDSSDPFERDNTPDRTVDLG